MDARIKADGQTVNITAIQSEHIWLEYGADAGFYLRILVVSPRKEAKTETSVTKSRVHSGFY